MRSIASSGLMRGLRRWGGGWRGRAEVGRRGRVGGGARMVGLLMGSWRSS